MTTQATADLDTRLGIIEDKLAIYELIASHPPSADTGHADYTRSVYREDGVFDRGPTLDGARGAEDIAAFIQRPEHDAARRGGLAHFTGLPLVDLRGDHAVVTSYLQIVHLDHEGAPRNLPNHGVSTARW
ncbi:nuclear transport factor 2 family protein [Consotaella aegiceratis]|uniref:nuclear transport factor 2 family protein n=1 Tax=Consotaella aegiceratis TaxID=3097961 RepID=UPI002F42901E